MTRPQDNASDTRRRPWQKLCNPYDPKCREAIDLARHQSETSQNTPPEVLYAGEND